MGSSQSSLPEDLLQEYRDLTYLSKQEIERCYDRFAKLLPSQDFEPDSLINPTRPHPLNRGRVTYDKIRCGIRELEFNPFCDRFCLVFSTAETEKGEEAGSLSFEDFLDLASVLSEKAPAELKADWAFRIFDFDGDGFLNAEDVKATLKRITEREGGDEGQLKLSEREMDTIVQHVLDEADIDRSGLIAPQEFRYIMCKSPDFAHNFRLRI